MAVAKICGIETEYGIVVRGAQESNPITASSLLINAYIHSLDQEHARARVGWDFDDEQPGNDARGESLRRSVAPEIETHLVNAVLTNGARYYVDHAHPEYSAPECIDALQGVLYDRAGEEILIRSMRAAAAFLDDGEELVVYKNNSDGKGNSYGCHENYLMDRSTPFSDIVAHATTHLVTRQIFTGAGKVGSELPGTRRDAVTFQVTQRADFFEEEVGLETTLKRPIVNTRDEPHADSKKYRRLHVIAGDANMSETATLLKLGTTAIVLAMVDDGALGDPIRLAAPVDAMHRVSLDVGLGEALRLADGSRATALELQWQLFERADRYTADVGLEAAGQRTGETVMALWREVLEGLESDPMSLADRLDWVAKYRLFDAYRERHGVGWDDPRLAAMDLQYHDLRPASSLAARVGLRTLVTPEQVDAAVVEPPADTRAYFRGRCLTEFPGDIVSANWDSIVFDVGGPSLKRVPMMEPGKGNRATVGALLDAADSAADLLERLDS